MKKMLLLKGLMILCVYLCCVQNVYAVGALFSRPRWSNVEYQKMWIQKIDATINIQEQIAVTHIDQTFFNEMNQSVESIYIFPLPENAVITELVYWVNGQRFVAAIRERQEAIRDYNEKLRQWLDPALLEYLGDNLFRLSIVPINALTEVRTEITYIEPLKYDLGKVLYNFQLNTLELSSKPLKTVSLSLNASSQYTFKSFASPSHGSSTATKITKVSEKEFTVMFGDENFYPDKDFRVEFELTREDVNYQILTYTPSPADSIGTDSYYALWITPPDQVDNQDLIAKNIVFTADVSSSMEGERITQLKTALQDFLTLLNPVDKFNIMIFGTFVTKFKPDLVEVNQTNISEARQFVDGLYALGMTNIDQALKESLLQSYGDSTSNNLVFLTDGFPTWGETNIDSILSHTRRNNTDGVRIFPFGVGEDLSKELLGKLAAENHGYTEFITADDSIALIVRDHFERISKPVLTDINVNFGGLRIWDQYPKIIEDLFWGNQLMQLGMYKTGGTYDITLTGKVRTNNFQFTKTITFPNASGGHRFVPRLWAKAKIDNILELIRLFGEKKELVDQVVELSLRFQILTPYTAFYSDPTTGVDVKKVIPEEFSLGQNYPNPFNPSTTIKYSLPSGRSGYNVVIRIFDLLGRLVITLVDSYQEAGVHYVTWNGLNSSGMPVPSGTYFYSLETEGFSITKKMILLK